MKLNELSDNPGARKPRKRVGRGMASGTGKTAGAGHKGQKARSGVAIGAFEGGQMPIYRRLPKRGFLPPSQTEYSVVNLSRLQKAVDAGKFEAGAVVDEVALMASGVVTKRRDGIKILGGGELSVALKLEVTAASKTAVEAVEKAGGSVDLGPKGRDAAPENGEASAD